MTGPSVSNKARDPWIYAILLLSFALHTYHLGYPAWDYHNWRQTITLMVARDFARHDFPLLHPQVAWIGNQPSDPSYFSAEFSIQSVLAAVLYKVLGESEVLARLVTIAFSLLGIWCLYSILRRRAGPMAARMGAFIYALLPYQLFFGRVFMPDIPALALALAGLDALDRWSDHPNKTGPLAAAATLTALAVLQKLTVIFVAMPMLYIFWAVYGKNLIKRKEPYLFALIAAVPVAAWYYGHALAIAPGSVLSALAMQRNLFARHLDLWLQGAFALRVAAALGGEAFSPVGLALAIAGLIFAPRGRMASIFRLWVAGAALVLLLIPGVVSANLYYLSLLLPGGAALAGMALARVPRYGQVAILAVFAAGAIYSAAHLYLPDRNPHELGLLLNSLTAPGDLLATEAGGSPNVLYYADRRGWLLEREYNLARIEQLRQSGARYYADTFAADAIAQRAFFRALDTRFARLTAEDAPWQIYDLAATPGPLHTPAAEMPGPRTVNFGDRIRFRGIALRPLLGRPDSFEVVYYWECLKPPPDDLRVFVHITDSAGQTVAQQDHWPQGGAFPTSKWKPGDLVRERYVLTLASSLPTGKYQIRLGWFDPVGGLRLPIVNPGASDRDDRALVGEIELPPHPTEGWFTAD